MVSLWRAHLLLRIMRYVLKAPHVWQIKTLGVYGFISSGLVLYCQLKMYRCFYHDSQFQVLYCFPIAQFLIDCNNKNLELRCRGKCWKIKEVKPATRETFNFIKSSHWRAARSYFHKSSDWIQCVSVSFYLIFLSLPSHVPSCLYFASAGIKDVWLLNTGIKGVSHHLLALFLF